MSRDPDWSMIEWGKLTPKGDVALFRQLRLNGRRALFNACKRLDEASPLRIAIPTGCEIREWHRDATLLVCHAALRACHSQPGEPLPDRSFEFQAAFRPGGVIDSWLWREADFLVASHVARRLS